MNRDLSLLEDIREMCSDAISFLGKEGISPGDYSDIYSLLNDCIRVKREYNLSDTKFIALMDSFDSWVPKNRED